MYVVTRIEDGVIMHISPTLNHQENGNLLLMNDTLAVACPANVSGDVTVPAGVEPDKYTYIDGVFAVNPNYVEPKLPLS